MGPPGRRVSQPARETLLLAVLAVAGALVVLLVLFADALVGTPLWTQYTDDRRQALRGPRWSLWIALLVGQGALWGVLLSLLLRAHVRLRAEASWRDLLATLSPLIVLSAIVDVVRYSTQVRSPLPGHFGKVTVVTWLGTLVALVAVAGIVRVGRAASSLDVEGRAAAALEAYLNLRSNLRQFLLIAGAVIAGAVLAAGALQSAVDGYRNQTGRPEAVLVYGLFLSTLLAAAYAPAFGALRNAGERVLEAVEPTPKPGDDDWPLGTPRRRELRAYLELDIGLVESLRVGVAVLAPLASGLLSLLLPG
jgi:hypothetical protein